MSDKQHAGPDGRKINIEGSENTVFEIHSKTIEINRLHYMLCYRHSIL